MKDEMKTGFFMALWFLRDYLQDIVIGGGWVSMTSPFKVVTL